MLVAGALIGGVIVVYSRIPERVGLPRCGLGGVVFVFLFLPLVFVVAHSFNDNKSLFM